MENFGEELPADQMKKLISMAHQLDDKGNVIVERFVKKLSEFY